MTSETFTIPLLDGQLKGDHYAANIENAQYVTLTDGGNLNSVDFAKWGKGAPTQAGQGPGGDDNFNIDLSGFNDDFSISVQSMDPGDTFNISGAVSWTNTGNIYSVDYIGSDSHIHSLSIDVESTNNTGIASINITCFGAGTVIETAHGLTLIEHLSVGDAVKCGDGQVRPIRWVSRRIVTAEEMLTHPEYRPIRIRQHALYDNVPNRDLLVSPQHRILIDDWRAELLFGADRVLVPAVHLLNDNDIIRDYTSDEFTYYHFMFDEHHTVLSNGLESESFYPGREAVQGIEGAARIELYALFPELENAPDSFGDTCCLTLKAHEAMAMVGL